jgi:hypothetical protein
MSAVRPTINAPPEYIEFSGPMRWTRSYKWKALAIMVAIEDERWHLSISHPARYPSWDEIKKARYDLCPKDITMVMFLPPPAEYVNVHNYCFHLHQIMKHEE